MPHKITRTPVTIGSEGSRLAAVVIRPAHSDGRRPAILFCHGWAIRNYSREVVRMLKHRSLMLVVVWGAVAGCTVVAVKPVDRRQHDMSLVCIEHHYCPVNRRIKSIG